MLFTVSITALRLLTFSQDDLEGLCDPTRYNCIYSLRGALRSLMYLSLKVDYAGEGLDIIERNLRRHSGSRKVPDGTYPPTD